MHLQKITFDIHHTLLWYLSYNNLLTILVFLLSMLLLNLGYYAVAQNQVHDFAVVQDCFSLRSPQGLMRKRQPWQPLQLYEFRFMRLPPTSEALKSEFDKLKGQQPNGKLYTGKHCAAVDNIVLSSPLSLGSEIMSVYLPSQKSLNYKYKIVTYLVYEQSMASYPGLYLFTSKQQILVQQLANYLQDKTQFSLLHYKLDDTIYHVDYTSRGQSRLVFLFWIICCLFLSSSVIAVYNYMSVYMVPVFYIIINRLRAVDFREIELFTLAPWLGLYQYQFQLNSQRKIRSGVVLAVVMLFSVYLVCFIGLMLLFKLGVFGSLSAMQQSGKLINFMTLLELESVVFFRTRTTILYLPKLIAITLIAYCYYTVRATFTFREMPFNLLVYATQSLLVIFLIKIQKPAVCDWNQNSIYTPTQKNPRCFYSPYFSSAWINDFPPLWTLFAGLKGAESFSEQQLQLVRPAQALNNPILE